MMERDNDLYFIDYKDLLDITKGKGVDGKI